MYNDDPIYCKVLDISKYYIHAARYPVGWNNLYKGPPGHAFGYLIYQTKAKIGGDRLTRFRPRCRCGWVGGFAFPRLQDSWRTWKYHITIFEQEHPQLFE